MKKKRRVNALYIPTRSAHKQESYTDRSINSAANQGGTEQQGAWVRKKRRMETQQQASAGKQHMQSSWVYQPRQQGNRTSRSNRHSHGEEAPLCRKGGRGAAGACCEGAGICCAGSGTHVVAGESRWNWVGIGIRMGVALRVSSMGWYGTVWYGGLDWLGEQVALGLLAVGRGGR